MMLGITCLHVRSLLSLNSILDTGQVYEGWDDLKLMLSSFRRDRQAMKNSCAFCEEIEKVNPAHNQTAYSYHDCITVHIYIVHRW